MPNKINIRLIPIEKQLLVNKNIPLIDVLHEFGVEFPCGGKGTCGKCKVKLIAGELEIDGLQKLKLQQLNLSGEWRLACFCKVNSDIELEIAQFENLILADNSTFDFSPQKGFGLAVDLGTTTVVVQLINLENGHLVDSESFVNPQTKFGADLISRIQYCLDGKQNELRELIRGSIGKSIENMVNRNKVELEKIVLVGNTAMHHIFSGIDVRPLSFYPFQSDFHSEKRFSPSDLNWNLPENCVIEFAASIGSFVGSDILAGIAATKMAENEKYSVLIDLGTNGEIVIGNYKKIVCASTAAGPAFEGAKISQGMRASTGAISSINYENGAFKNHVIGNVAAKGICGSGLIDVVAILLEQQKIGMFGEINSGDDKVELAREVFLTQSDIREFQLAKAAVATGVQILLNNLGITMNEIEKIFIAGGFGNFLNLKNVIRTGLIESDEEKIVKFGNTALIGAKMFLFEKKEVRNKILEKTTHINLEADPSFQDIYIEKMMLI